MGINIGKVKNLYSAVLKDTNFIKLGNSSGPIFENKFLKWRTIHPEKLEKSLLESQKISNCYDEAVRHSLISSNNGRQRLLQRIETIKDANGTPIYRVSLNINGENKIFQVNTKDYIKYRDIFERYGEEIPTSSASKEPRLSIILNIAINKMLKNHPEQKPFISRLWSKVLSRQKCEFNKPSNAYKWYTGISPISIGETSMAQTLKSQRDKVIALLKRLGQRSSTDYSFTALSGFVKQPDGHMWHCYPVTNVNLGEQTITLLEKRSLTEMRYSFDEFISNFKAIVGILWQ